MTGPLLEFRPEQAKPLLQEVMERSGQMLTACYQCRRCAAGCTVADETGFFTPNILIRTVILGDRETALSNPLVWKCVSCYTCGTRCPNDIQTARITETLKKMAKEAHIAPLQPKVAAFHDSFLESGLRWGRVNEMEFMGVYEMKNIIREARARNYEAIVDELKTQAKLGMAMFRLKRMHAGFMTTKGRKEIKALYRKTRKKPGVSPRVNP
ncbi:MULTISPECIES: 4Fe-4S dicluster domain-containing protein [Desulfococcus]|jgi:heterodisulfide reductase subunit C|uniref:4Fe-4S ferredoxin, iron-sulpur binding domain-containing protein n=1 Tax=Desulfococcus multivorans DSM 2059 TaxID=1121405 RepID=S7TMB9_DESML|nr:4Fe-4S dicluster domain-containing protein [Desulfococcus multivorans]AOY59658.1 HdrC: CoB--CoM heterodisulfide reductase, iron-sulfur subunit gamma [Desulfococcus multivorans]AQV01842.1 heterodisulfide reductase subunit C-like protein [Desulfococcus multivorans]EPR37855.1 4Fe-4S ferredoxin, iron-sulpur binding domain-containing protein [Desulfococcus multivorans DSM 2059]MDX9819324.1 4Fe-4S dicluster domain-containing protein [Desulfococcus multivorans]SKA16550.1 heterodisulfide reductase 